MRKIKVIIKRPDSPPYTTHISNTLANLQKTVDGPIECVYLANDLIMVCNEEGKLRGLESNFRLYGDAIVGTAIFIGTKGEDFVDCPVDLKELKKALLDIGTVF